MPFTLFCHQHSSEDALNFLSEHNAEIQGDENHWDASYVFGGKLFQKKKKITFDFDREWCSSPNWPTQLTGMNNYVADFEMDEERHQAVAQLISQFQYCLGIIAEPEITQMDDPRLEVMNALANHLNGVFFTPDALLDSHFRPFAAIDGEFDPDAIIPEVLKADLQPEDEFNDEPPDPEPPIAQRVARRMYVLLALAARGLLDMNLRMGNEPAYRLDELHQWLDALDINEEFEPEEREIVYTEEQKLSQQDTINSVWRLEGLVVLAWALQLVELPQYDQLVETDDLLSATALLDVTMSKHHLAQCELRSAEELDRYNDQVWAFNWRMVDYRVNHKAVDYANVEFGWGKLDLSWASLLEGDLAIQEAPILNVEQDVLQTMNSIARERHAASNWLRGDEKLYSEISTDT